MAYAGRPDKAGTAGGQELLLPIGASSISLSGSNIASVSGLESIYWNPAGLSTMNSNYGFLFSHMNYIADISVEYAAVAFSLPSFGSVGLSLKTLDVGEIKVTTETNPDGTGETTSPSFITFGGVFSRKITDRISVGAGINLLYEKMSKVSATSISFNMGVQYDGIGGINGLGVGVAVKNIGPQIKFDGNGLFRDASIKDATGKNSIVKIESAGSDLPSIIEVGLSYKFQIAAITNWQLHSTFQNNNYSADNYNFGLSFNYQEHFFFRIGLSVPAEIARELNIFGSTYGFGLKHTVGGYKIELDYAYRIVRFFNGNHVFSIIFEG